MMGTCARQFLLCALLGFCGLSAEVQGKPLSLFDHGQHCVAYRAKKTMFLVRSVQVVGRNCEVSTKIIPIPGGKSYFEATVPVSEFESGESQRDRDVRKVLKASTHPNMVFRSEERTMEEWKAIQPGAPIQLKGELEIGGKKTPIQAQAQLVRTEGGLEIDGVVKTRFEDLGLKPPQLVMGLMAQVKQDLELHFHFLGNRTLGFNRFESMGASSE